MKNKSATDKPSQITGSNKKNKNSSSDQAVFGSTPYDDAFRTMMEKSGKLRIPFINEMFHPKKPIPADARIENISNSYFIEEGHGKQQRIITDSVLHIGENTYHVECQSKNDGTILVRMFEYDVSVALNESSYEDFHLKIQMPYSGVLFLRANGNTPEQMKVTLEADGHRIEYPVKTILLSDYTLDDLIQKDLLFLFPFYMFNLEKQFESYENQDEAARKSVAGSMSDLLEEVNNLYHTGQLSFEHYLLITDMTEKVTNSLTRKYKNVRKELNDLMGGKVLEFRGEREFNEGKKAGLQEGEIRGRKAGIQEGKKAGKVYELIDLVYDGVLPKDVAANRAETKYGISPEDFQKMLDSYDPDEELMQG